MIHVVAIDEILSIVYNDLDLLQEFIMLENLVAPYRFPCVMDLKMGTSHRSPDASEAKKRLLEERWLASTSASLGFRMCGIQVNLLFLVR